MDETLELTSFPNNMLACCNALLDKKAVDLTVLDVRGQSSVTDYYVIASGESSPQLKAMVNSARKSLKEEGEKWGIVDGDPQSGWVVLDAYDFVIHLFLTEMRENYALDSLWKDRPRLVLTD